MRRIISVLAVMAIVAAMAVAMVAPAFAAGGIPGQGNAHGIHDTNYGRTVNDYNESNSQKGEENGSDNIEAHGRGDYRN